MIKFDEPCNVLLVDDSSTARMFLKKGFEKAGFTNKNFIMAADGQQALDILPVQNINLIVTDLTMPKIDGHELIRRVKSVPEHSQIPIIVITSSNNPAKEEELIAAGAEVILTKPVEAEALCEALKKVCDKISLKNGKILAFKDTFSEILNSMTSIGLTESVINAKLDYSFLDDSRQVAISTLNPPGYRFVLTIKTILLKKLASIICDIKPGELTAENEIETLSELLNTSAGAFLKKITPPDRTFDFNLPVISDYPLSGEGIKNCAFKIKDNIYVVLSMVEPLAIE